MMFPDVVDLAIEFLERVASANLLYLLRPEPARLPVQGEEVGGLPLYLVEELRNLVVAVEPVADLERETRVSTRDATARIGGALLTLGGSSPMRSRMPCSSRSRSSWM